VRRVVILSSIAFPATLFCLSFAPTFGVALALGFAAGLVGCGVSQYSYLAVLPHFFDRRLGLSLGIAMIGMGLGTSLVPQVAQHLTHSYGWRDIYRILAALIAVIGLPNALLLPRTDQLLQSASKQIDAALMGGMTAAEALRSQVFYQLALCIFLSIAVTTGLAIHLTALLTDRGYGPERAAGVFSLFGLGIGLLSVAIGLDGDLLPYATRSYFGLRSYSTIYGMLGAAYSLGPPVGSFMLGQGFDRFGGYTPLLWGIVGIVALSALLLMALGRPDSPEYRVRAMSHLRARA